MAAVPGKRLLSSAMSQLRSDMNDAFKVIAEEGKSVILGAADFEGKLDPNRQDDVQIRVGNLVQRFFVGPDFRRPYDRDGVTPLAEFPRILNYWYVAVVVNAVQYHHDWLQKKLPEDVFDFLASGGRDIGVEERRRQHHIIREEDNPFLRRPNESPEDYRQRLDALRIFRPNPLAELDPERRWVPMHRWNDPNGYRLSDRIWQGSVRTRVRIDALIAEGFREGWSASRLASTLERFLLPDRANLRTRRPYGTDASYDAMRIARTEIARAANHAAFTAAYMNPYVDTIDVVRSSRGDPKCPICPQHATIDISGQRVRDPYPIDRASIPPFHPHDMCRVQSNVTQTPAEVTAQLQAVMQDAQRDLLEPAMNPAAMQSFIQQLVGRSLMDVVAQVMQLPLF